MKELRIILLLAAVVALWAPGCDGKQSQMGVQNKWRAASPPPFQKGKTSQSEAMTALGPPPR